MVLQARLKPTANEADSASLLASRPELANPTLVATMNEIAGRIAQHLGAPPQVIAPQGDGRPDMKPG